MNKIFKFILTSEDRTARAFRSFGDRMKHANKSGEKLSKIGKLWDKVSGTKLGGKFRNIAGDLGELSEGAGAAVEAMGVAGATAAGAAAAVVGLGVAMAVATKKGWDFVEPFAKGSNEIRRTSRLIGVSTQDLQHYRSAAEMAGLSQDDMTSSLANLGSTVQDALAGRNHDALALFNRLGVRLTDVHGKARKATDVMLDLADAMKRQTNPQTQARIADMFGVSPVLTMLQDGKGKLQHDVASAAAANPGMSDEQLKQLDKMNNDTLRLHQSWTRLKLNLAENFVIPWLGPTLDKLSNFMDRHGTQIPDMIKGAVSASLAAAPGGAGPAALAAAQHLFGANAPRGLRTNNPGNMRDWKTGAFRSFPTAEAGLNAMGGQLLRYQDKYGLDTVRGIISRWAPANENQTGAYISTVSGGTGFGPDQKLNLHDPATLAKLQASMIGVENGRNPFSQQQIMGANHTVDVNVHLAGAPSGTVVQAKTSPQARAGITVATPALGGAAAW